MLSLIPALLLLAFHGPAALERLGSEGRLPSALRGLDRQVRSEGTLATEPNARAQKAFCELAALTADFRFSAAVALFFGELADELAGQAPHRVGPIGLVKGTGTEPIVAQPGGATADGILECRRSRDGPGQ